MRLTTPRRVELHQPDAVRLEDGLLEALVVNLRACGGAWRDGWGLHRNTKITNTRANVQQRGPDVLLTVESKTFLDGLQ